MPQSIQSLSQRKEHTTSDNNRCRKYGAQNNDHDGSDQHDRPVIEIGRDYLKEGAGTVLQGMSHDVDRYQRFVIHGQANRLNETAQTRDHGFRHEHVFHGYHVEDHRHLSTGSDLMAVDGDSHYARHSFHEDFRRRAMHLELGRERARTPNSMDTEPPTSAPPSLENSLIIDVGGENPGVLLQHVNGWNELGRRECEARYASVIDEEDVKSEMGEAR